MHLVKLTVTMDAAISRCELKERIKAVLPDAHVNGAKVPTDAIRVALAYKLRPWNSFEHDGKQCKAIAASPKSVARGTVHTDIHVQERDENGVSYTSNVCTIRYTVDEGIRWEVGPDFDKYKFIVDDIDPAWLQATGEQNYFHSDIRALFTSLTDKSILKFWAGGLYVCLTDEQYAHLCTVRDLFTHLDTGVLKCRAVSLDNTEANKLSVAEGLTEDVFVPAFEDLTARAKKAGANYERIESDYVALLEKIAETEQWLQTDIACAQAQEAFEIALSDLYAKQ